MFEIGLKDTITVHKPPSAGRNEDGDRTYTEPSKPIENQACRKVTEEKVLTDQTGARITVQKTKVIVNYTGSAVNNKCTAEVNSVMYEIKSVKPASGFGRDFIEIEIESRDE